MSRRAATNSSSSRGFSLVEMLVVAGILVVVMGLLLPAIMRARSAARTTICTTNLRQLGELIHLYADQNNDYIPLGSSTVPHYVPPFVPEQDLLIRPAWRTDWNDFMSVHETPSAALGPLLINGMIYQNNAQLCFCPLEQRKKIRVDLKRQLFPEQGSTTIGGTIQISYAIRPESFLWTYRNDGVNIPPVTYPKPMAKLESLVHQALLAEPPERPPYNHGSEKAPAINVCFNDGSVRLVHVHDFTEFSPKPWFEAVDEPYATRVQNDSAMPVWRWLDNQ